MDSCFYKLDKCDFCGEGDSLGGTTGGGVTGTIKNIKHSLLNTWTTVPL